MLYINESALCSYRNLKSHLTLAMSRMSQPIAVIFVNNPI